MPQMQSCHLSIILNGSNYLPHCVQIWVYFGYFWLFWVYLVYLDIYLGIFEVKRVCSLKDGWWDPCKWHLCIILLSILLDCSTIWNEMSYKKGLRNDSYKLGKKLYYKLHFIFHEWHLQTDIVKSQGHLWSG